MPQKTLINHGGSQQTPVNFPVSFGVENKHFLLERWQKNQFSDKNKKMGGRINGLSSGLELHRVGYE